MEQSFLVQLLEKHRKTEPYRKKDKKPCRLSSNWPKLLGFQVAIVKKNSRKLCVLFQNSKFVEKTFNNATKVAFHLPGGNFRETNFLETKVFFRYQAKVCQHNGLKVCAVMLKTFSNCPLGRVDYKKHFEKEYQFKFCFLHC